MSSEVDIANLALSHLGDSATVASLNPPEGSAQAEHCARYYPMARDALLESHAWSFASKRVQLAQLTSEWAQWDYAYARPNDALVVRGVLSPTAQDDNTDSLQPYTIEVDASGAQVIYTDQETAVGLYTRAVTDTVHFPPAFVMALSWQLASMLAGPMIKGDTGAAEGKRCVQMQQYWHAKAVESDANQRRISRTHTPAWMQNR